MANALGSFEDEVFGPLVPERECGGCTACCFEITIDDPALQKPPRQLCPNCTDGGCAIYTERPQDCRDWFCLWRRLAEAPDALRPDRSGLMPCFMVDPTAENPLQRLYIVLQWLDSRPIEKSASADALLAALRRFGLPVWVGSGERMALHFPRQEVALALMGAPAAAPELAQEVALWRSRLTPPI